MPSFLLAATEESSGGLIDVVPGLMIWTLICFAITFFVLESLAVAVVAVPAAAAFYLFEVVIVVSIQAFIFAALSAIYIGSAIEPEH